MAEPPPRTPPDDHEAETVIASGSEWPVRPESQVVVEQTETLPPPRPRRPLVWPWLLALLVLVVAGLGAAYLLTRDDDEPASTTEAATTAPTTTTAEMRAVPDVVGTTSSQATETLRDAGFDVNVVAVPSDRPPGTVVAQSPKAGTEHPEGTSIRLNVAEAATTTAQDTTTTAPTTTVAPAPQPATVPDVVGQELADAATAFAAERLKVAVAYVPSREAAGRVVAQAQPAGTERRRGDTVQLNVSIGADPPERASVPSVAGRTLEDARDALEGAGFEVKALGLAGGEIRNESEVSSQSPAGGASVPRGSLVLLYVAD
jgi:beta-lactam-binding protein with PASTA domain